MSKLGYQGIENSNVHTATLHFVEKHGWSDMELIPLVSSINVIEALKKGEIQYGICAYTTDVAGPVAETAKALEGVSVNIMDTYSIDIHHNLFKKDDSVSNDEITAIASHPEALRECQKNINKMYPKAESIPVQNTAVAARDLNDGKLPKTTAVLCSKKAGAQYNLSLIQENIEDLEHNGTSFALMTL